MSYIVIDHNGDTIGKVLSNRSMTDGEIMQMAGYEWREGINESGWSNDGSTYYTPDDIVTQSIDANGLTYDAASLIVSIWQEQINAGIGEPGETADIDHVADWIGNHSLTIDTYNSAGNGNVASITVIRQEAGLPALV